MSGIRNLALAETQDGSEAGESGADSNAMQEYSDRYKNDQSVIDNYPKK